MIQEFDINWLIDIINDIVIINSDFNIIFIGEGIKNKLFNLKKKIDQNFLENFINSEFYKDLKYNFNNSKQNNKTLKIKLKKIKKELFIFPTIQNNRQIFIISFNEKILKISQMQYELNERVKELECLYKINFELDSSKNLKTALKKSIQYLINGFQFPEFTSATIVIDGEKYGSKNYVDDKVENILKHNIIINKKIRGYVEIYYHKEIKFLKEEKKLLKEISAIISKAVEKQDLTIELKSYVGNLEKLVEEKTFELEVSRKRFEDLFNNAPDGITISDFNGKIIKANKAFYKLIKYPKRHQLHYIQDNLLYDISDSWSNIVKQLKEKKFFGSCELTIIDKDKNLNPVIGSFILLKDLENTYIEAIYKDISFKKEIEKNLLAKKDLLEKLIKERTKDLEKQRHLLLLKNKALIKLTDECHRSRKKIETLLTAITDTIIVINENFIITKSNKKNIKIGSKCFKSIFKNNDICKNCPAELSFKTKKSESVERKIDNKYFLLQTYPIVDKQGKVESVLELFNDMTKEKQIEFQLLQTDKLTSLGKIVSGIAHEINNPNTFIRGNINIIKESFNDIIPILNKEYRNNENLKIARLDYNVFKENIPLLIEDIANGTTRIKKIVEDLRHFARKDEGLLIDNVEINEVIKSSIRLVENQVSRHANIELKLNNNIPTFKGNIQKLEQVMVNLIINASQSIENKFGNITVETQCNEHNENIVIYIIDNGSGMDENTIKYIFDPFFTTKRNRGGTGLGLSIVYGIIEEHRGHIDVESKLNKGTTFRISIPYKKVINND